MIIPRLVLTQFFVLFFLIVSCFITTRTWAVCCSPETADVAIGSYAGDPAATWDGLVQLGLQTRTFKQQNLLNPQEQLVRRYLQYVPASISNKHGKYPLVIALHGANLNAEVFREWDIGNRLEKLADKEHFVLVYANAFTASELDHPDIPFWANAGYWRACHGHRGRNEAGFYSVDDTDYLRKVIAQVAQEGLPVDLERVYLMGMSNGGEMVQRATREMADQLAGVGAVMPVNGMPATEDVSFCKKGEQKPVSMMFIYSPKDTLLDWAYLNILGVNYGTIMKDTLAAWRNAMKIDSKTERTHLLPNKVVEGQGYTGDSPWAIATMNSQITRYDYKTSPLGVRFAVLEINQAAGHAWPNSAPTKVEVASENHNGFRNQDINAEAVLWDFLKTGKRIHN